MSDEAAHILMLAGLCPDKASLEEIALAERLAKEYKYPENAARQFRLIYKCQ